MNHPQHLSRPDEVQLEGLLGRALHANRSGHLTAFVADETSRPIALFAPARVCCNHEGDWYGEHAGKWLYTAARAAQRTSDPGLIANLHRVAGYLVHVQEPDGYLGTYAPARTAHLGWSPGAAHLGYLGAELSHSGITGGA